MKAIEVPVHDYRITEDDNVNLFTQGLEACIGISLIEKTQKNTKRGLVHLFYDGSRNFDYRIIDYDLKRFLKEFLNKKSLQCCISAIPFRCGEKGYENIMIDYVLEKLRDNQITILNENIDNEREISDNSSFPRRIRTIYFKDMILNPKKVIILYRTGGGKIIGQKICLNGVK